MDAVLDRCPRSVQLGKAVVEGVRACGEVGAGEGAAPRRPAPHAHYRDGEGGQEKMTGGGVRATSAGSVPCEPWPVRPGNLRSFSLTPRPGRDLAGSRSVTGGRGVLPGQPLLA